MSLFGRGSKDLPVIVTVSPYHVPTMLDAAGTGSSVRVGGTGELPVNPLLRVFSSIDLGFVVGMILSLFCILLVFDGFSGEKEQGALRLMLSSPVGRLQLLAGKYLGAVITAAIPLAAGILVTVIIWNVSGLVTLGGGDWAALLCIFAASLLYLACFVALGLLISLFAGDSVTGLVHQLLAWVIAGVVFPACAGFASDILHPVPRMTELVHEAEERYQHAYGNVPYQQTGDGGWNGVSLDYTGGESFLAITGTEALHRLEYNKIVFPMKFALAEELFRIRDAVQRELDLRDETRNRIGACSPVMAYMRIIRAMAGSDPGSYRRTFAAAREYRELLMDYLRPRVATAAWFTRVLDQPELQPTKENLAYWNARAEKEGGDVLYKEWLSWDRVRPLDLAGMPRPSLEVAGLEGRLQEALLPLCLLMALTVAFLMLAGWKLLRYSV
jgi:ABC-type transport system involved in multi-copper enzyme maturation permease subunit